MPAPPSTSRPHPVPLPPGRGDAHRAHASRYAAEVVSTTVYLKDLNEFGTTNGVYGSYFPSQPPARTTVEVARLPTYVKVEIGAIAVKR